MPDPSPCPCSDLNLTPEDHPLGCPNAKPCPPLQVDCWMAREDEPEMEWLLQPRFFTQRVKVTYLLLLPSSLLMKDRKTILTTLKSNLSRNRTWFIIEMRLETNEKDRDVIWPIIERKLSKSLKKYYFFIYGVHSFGFLNFCFPQDHAMNVNPK
jgi:hypothetical protein